MILENLVLDLVDLLREVLPIGGEEQVVVREVGRVSDSDELQDSAEEGHLVEGSEEARGHDEGDQSGEGQGHDGWLVLGLLPLLGGGGEEVLGGGFDVIAADGTGEITQTQGSVDLLTLFAQFAGGQGGN